MVALVVAVLAGAWIVRRSTEVASEAEAQAPTSPASATPTRPQLTNDRTSSEATADPPSASETPFVVVAAKVDRSPAKGCALAFGEAVYRDLTELALEAGKSKEWADESPFLGLAFAVAEASGDSPEDGEAMFRRLAAEQAGRVAPPTDLSGFSLDERFTRMTMAWGDEFERALAARLGPDRASTLQHANDGWPGPRVQSENLCNGNQDQML